MEEATDLARSFTNGQGADAAIVTVGITTGEHVAQAFAAIRKGGTAVATGMGPLTSVGIPIPWPSSRCIRSGCKGRCSAAAPPPSTSPCSWPCTRPGSSSSTSW
jgi:S-(hydroxymethyl)glutathione dehydrogenase/alcohol dehydrogenase